MCETESHINSIQIDTINVNKYTSTWMLDAWVYMRVCTHVGLYTVRYVVLCVTPVFPTNVNSYVCDEYVRTSTRKKISLVARELFKSVYNG